jgi:hypothetical protein
LEVEMRKALLILIAAIFVFATASPSSASLNRTSPPHGVLDVNAKGSEGSTITPSPPDRTIRLRMFKDHAKTIRACYDSGPDKVTIVSSAFDPNPDKDNTERYSYDLWIKTRLHGVRGSTYPVTATCGGWVFDGNVTIRTGQQPGKMPMTGMPALPTATLGLTLIVIGGLLLLGGRRRPATGADHPAGRASQVRR